MAKKKKATRRFKKLRKALEPTEYAPPEPEQIPFIDDEDDDKELPDPDDDDDEFEPEDEQRQALVRRDARDAVRYLTSDTVASPRAIVALVPIDLMRCQCEWRDQTLEGFGPKPIIRCDEEPTVVAFQKRTEEDIDPTGAISLCDEHRVMIEHMYPGQCFFRRITDEKKIGDFA